jgi:vancomycin resistance protein YoaR
MRATTAALVLLGTAIAAAGCTIAALAPRVVPNSGAVPGLRIGGRALDAGEDISRHVESRATEIQKRTLALRLGSGRVVKRSLGELGLRIDAGQVTRRAEAIGRHGHLALRLDELRRARRGEIDVPLSISFDPAPLAALLLPLKEETDVVARPARFDLETGAIVAHAAGQYLDFDAAIAELERTALAIPAPLEITIPRRSIAPRVDAALLRGTSIETVLSEFVTHFALDPNRSKNIEVAASRLDGVVLAPGELVSFNEAVGARTEQNGFRPAPEIYKGEMVRGIGGGTCQVSSTFHAAAMHAGFDVVERYPHSRPSGYISLGLDSTVSWPSVDLKLRNPFPFAVVVDTRVERGKLQIRLLGREKPATVELHSDTLAVIPFKRKVTESPWLEAGKVVQKQKGIRGYSIRKTRRIVLANGSERVETTIDHYPPTPELLVVAPGTSEADLPPLPDGAAESEPDEREATGNAVSVPPRG